MRRPLPLNTATLPALGDLVIVPRYLRDQLTTGVVHLGVGNFHRAHQAVYFDRLAELGLTDWGVTGVGLRSRALKDALSAQDNLFLVVSRDAGGARARVVGSLVECLYAPDEGQRALAALSSPNTHLVTLTITGNGYHQDGDDPLDEGDGPHGLDRPGSPTTTFGYLVEGLHRRRLSGAGGLTVLSCDNLPDSGATTRAVTLAVARRREPGLADWIEERVPFPNAMVDRITPATTRQERRFVRDGFGVRDRWPVVTESFSQWVVEDSFAGRRPPLDEVGVQYVRDVTPYKLVKTRLLNGGHCALGYLGLLSGHTSSSEAMGNPLIRGTLHRLLFDEVAPLLPSLPGVELGDYCATVLERFANPHIADPLTRLAGRGSTKMPAYLLPSLHQARREGRPAAALIVVVALWMRYLRGSTLDGHPYDLQDAQGAELQALAIRGRCDPRPLLTRTDLFGDLREDTAVVDLLTAVLVQLDQQGIEGVLASRLSRSSLGSAVPLRDVRSDLGASRADGYRAAS